MSKKKKKTKSYNSFFRTFIFGKAILRLCIFFIFFGTITLYLSYSFFSNVTKIFEIKEEKKLLEDKLIVLQDKEEELNSDIKKLEDPEYAGRYAREDGMLSKDGEIIFRIPD